LLVSTFRACTYNRACEDFRNHSKRRLRMKQNHWNCVPPAIFALLIGLTQCALADDAASSASDAAKESIEGKYLKNVQQITFDFAKAGEGYFSPDGRSIIFQAVPREYMFYQIYTLELPGGTPAPSGQQPAASSQPKLVSTGRGRTTCSFFAPD